MPEGNAYGGDISFAVVRIVSVPSCPSANSMKWDQIYTPVELCGKILAPSSSQRPNIVADFAAGSGELLKAAALKWPSAKIIAVDIDKGTVRKLRRKQPP